MKSICKVDIRTIVLPHRFCTGKGSNTGSSMLFGRITNHDQERNFIKEYSWMLWQDQLQHVALRKPCTCSYLQQLQINQMFGYPADDYANLLWLTKGNIACRVTDR